MKLTIRRGGGLAGMVAQTELDASSLPKPDAETFAWEIDRAGLREQPVPPPSSRWPDAQLYEISLEEAGPPVSVHYTDANLPEGVRLLLAWVDQRPERVESLEQ
ncbi:protealysin inhibitor emfourin [Arthrobacter sp.]|jgi:hypothetical protein|uniref:protealysin inhibitor emfourin n=1 Tax=Arthrobacter sp. TaxID=1667 RepID=UPI00258AD242|nr:protealysin inhibitor emfourin [Arthrobacter sp.]